MMLENLTKNIAKSNILYYNKLAGILMEEEL